MDFIERNILPQYAAFDAAHNMEHVTRVVRSSIALAQSLGADVDMAYTIAAYHDLGLSGPRAIHHLTSGKILQADRRLARWFTPQQITIMRQAVEDHRASASRAPRTIYGRIVAEADRDLDPDTVLERTVRFSLDNYPDYTPQQHWQRFCQHLQQKYAEGGYIKLWLPGSPAEANLRALRAIIGDKPRLRALFDKLFKRFAD